MAIWPFRRKARHESHARKSSRAGGARRIPVVEALEDRCLLSSVVWTQRGTDADWPRLYGLNAQTGATLLEQRYQAQWGSNERPVIRDNQLVVDDGYYGGISAYTASTLVKQWNRPGSIYTDPFAALDSTYV